MEEAYHQYGGRYLVQMSDVSHHQYGGASSVQWRACSMASIQTRVCSTWILTLLKG